MLPQRARYESFPHAYFLLFPYLIRAPPLHCAAAGQRGQLSSRLLYLSSCFAHVFPFPPVSVASLPPAAFFPSPPPPASSFYVGFRTVPYSSGELFFFPPLPCVFRPFLVFFCFLSLPVAPLSPVSEVAYQQTPATYVLSPDPRLNINPPGQCFTMRKLLGVFPLYFCLSPSPSKLMLLITSLLLSFSPYFEVFSAFSESKVLFPFSPPPFVSAQLNVQSCPYFLPSFGL